MMINEKTGIYIFAPHNLLKPLVILISKYLIDLTFFRKNEPDEFINAVEKKSHKYIFINYNLIEEEYYFSAIYINPSLEVMFRRRTLEEVKCDANVINFIIVNLMDNNNITELKKLFSWAKNYKR